MSALAAILARLVAETSATSATVFGSSLAIPPTGDGPFLSVVETPGPAPEGTHTDGPTAYRRPSFQVTARAKSYVTARALAHEAYTALTVSNLTLSSIDFLSLRPQQEPFELPPDGANRARVAFNVLASHAT